MKLAFLSLIIFSTQAYGSLTFTKEYKFPPSLISKIEQSLHAAMTREPEFQEFAAVYPVDVESGILLWCPARSPDGKGNGCSLDFSIKTESFALAIRKPMALSFSNQQIMDRLKKKDPNTTHDDQYFGSLFVEKMSPEGLYFCKAEGNEGAKVWQCYLRVQEVLGK